jgi:hypothetical protein
VFCCDALLALFENADGKNAEGDIAPMKTFVASGTPAEIAAERESGSKRIGSSERCSAGVTGGAVT